MGVDEASLTIAVPTASGAAQIVRNRNGAIEFEFYPPVRTEPPLTDWCPAGKQFPPSIQASDGCAVFPA
jgi:hypothetical protein